MRRAVALVMLAILLATPVAADPLEDLTRAEAALSAARSNQAQRGAVGRALRAYESAMHDLTAQTAQTGQVVRTLDRTIASETEGVRSLLTALIRLGRVSEPRLLVSTDPPEETLRALILLDRLSSDARRRIGELNAQRAERQALQIRQTQAFDQLARSRARLTSLRRDLIAQSRARLTAPASALPDIGADTAVLAALAVALSSTLIADAARVESLEAPLPNPVEARLLRGFNAPGPAGLRRPGVAVAAAPGAVVTSPLDATVRFAGHLDGYGQVVILEPNAEVLLVLGGLGSTLVQPAEIVARDTVLGFLPQDDNDHEEFLPTSSDASGQLPTKTLYIELRYNQQPVDPARWFRYDR
ncbi:MAG: peptidoglycan DD-metalloendopeptidase family protein [Pseudomonadota bacterium]